MHLETRQDLITLYKMKEAVESQMKRDVEDDGVTIEELNSLAEELLDVECKIEELEKALELKKSKKGKK